MNKLVFLMMLCAISVALCSVEESILFDTVNRIKEQCKSHISRDGMLNESAFETTLKKYSSAENVLKIQLELMMNIRKREKIDIPVEHLEVPKKDGVHHMFFSQGTLTQFIVVLKKGERYAIYGMTIQLGNTMESSNLERALKNIVSIENKIMEKNIGIIDVFQKAATYTLDYLIKMASLIYNFHILNN
jgi:hypothetical protein